MIYIIAILLVIVIIQNFNFMATFKELSDKVDALQAALDAEQAQIKNAIDTLIAEVEKLRTDVTEGGTSEERQALADKLDGVIADLTSTIADTPTGGEGTE